MLSGRLAPSIGAFDNASEFSAGMPTMAHYLALLGYRAILCGKMQCIGPDQLHGFEERLTTEISKEEDSIDDCLFGFPFHQLHMDDN